MIRTEWTEDAATEVVSAYRGGESIRSLAKRFGVSITPVRKLLIREGVERRDQNEHNRIRWTEEQIASIAAAYRDGESAPSIAARFGCSLPTISLLLKKQGVVLRDAAERRRVYTCNEHFFDDVDTEEKAYWLGFLAADGCVFGDRRVTLKLSAKDEGHLEKYRRAIGSERPFRREDARLNGRVYPQVSLEVRSDTMVLALARHGIVPRKTHTLEPPSLREGLMRHYWRGLFDGDGCITLDGPTGWKATQLGSEPIVRAFAEFARLACDTVAEIRPYGRIYTFSVGGNGMVTTLLAAIYDGASIYLERKHALYIDAKTRASQPRPRAKTLTIGDATRTLAEWAKTVGKDPRVIRGRLNLGWEPEKAVFASIDTSCSRRKSG